MLELIPTFPAFVSPRNKTCVDPNKTWVWKQQSSLLRFHQKQYQFHQVQTKKNFFINLQTIQELFLFLQRAIAKCTNRFPLENIPLEQCAWSWESQTKWQLPPLPTFPRHPRSQRNTTQPRTGRQTRGVSATPGSDKRLGLHVLCIKWDAAWQSRLKIRLSKSFNRDFDIDSTLRFSLYAENEKWQKWPCHVSTCYLSSGYNQVSTMWGRVSLVPIFNEPSHQRSRTICHRYAFDFSVWSGRHVDLETRWNHSASVKPPTSQHWHIGRKTYGKIMPKLGI